jgi:hypothetical protein
MVSHYFIKAELTLIGDSSPFVPAKLEVDDCAILFWFDVILLSF